MKYCGVDYYPEQWGLEYLEEDLNNIVELGCNLIRIGDFAWSFFERQEGQYDFKLFDKVIAEAKNKGLKVMMGIPTATMPPWLYKKYPEIMNVSKNGYKQAYGARRGYCVNSDIYKEKAISLAKAIANHYKGNDTIVAYQVDNEIGHEGSDECYCESCTNKFRQYLKDKYKDIDKLNQTIGSSFWSQLYNDFDEVQSPMDVFQTQNPSLMLEYHRFRAISQENYLKELVDAIKEVDDKLVTHDFEGGILGKMLNPYEISKHLDFVSYNNYPVWGGQEKPLNDVEYAFSLEYIKGFKRENYCITEAIMGAQGHDYTGCAPKPNEAIKWSEDSLKHGAESIIFFRYRGFTKGAEQYCFGVLDPDNEKRRKYREVQAFFKNNRNVNIELKKSEAVLITDFDSKSSMMIQRQSNDFNYQKECEKLFGEFYKRNISIDVTNSDVNLSDYKYVILPYMIIMDNDFKSRLKEYVSNGGILVITPRTSWKDKDNNLVFGKRIPIDLTDLIGGKLEEQESLLSGSVRDVEFNGKIGKGSIFVEMYTKTTAKGLAKWVNCPFGEYDSLLVNEYGKGKCYTLTTSFDPQTLNDIFEIIIK